MTSEKKINPFIAFLQLIRIENLLIIVATQYLFEYFVFKGLFAAPDQVLVDFYGSYQLYPPFRFGPQLSHFDFFLLSLSTAMIAAAGYIINDYFDVKTDRINRPDRIVIDRGIKRRVAIAAHTVINIIGIALGLWVGHKAGNYQLGLLHVFTAGLLWFYSTTFKKMFFIGNVVVALLTGLVPVIVALFETHLLNLRVNNAYVLNPLYKTFIQYLENNGMEFDLKVALYWATGFGSFAFLLNLMREIVKDMQDFVGDMETGGRTIPITLGYKTTKNIVHGINLLTLIALCYVMFKLGYQNGDKLSVAYLGLLVCVPLIAFSFLLRASDSTKKFRKTGMFLKFVMLAGILYSFLVYYNFTKV
jgi:4-hydroxybenzoate polyprenyltransferase